MFATSGQDESSLTCQVPYGLVVLVLLRLGYFFTVRDRTCRGNPQPRNWWPRICMEMSGGSGIFSVVNTEWISVPTSSQYHYYIFISLGAVCPSKFHLFNKLNRTIKCCISTATGSLFNGSKEQKAAMFLPFILL